MFEPGTIWAYPTDTSFGLGARCDDLESLKRLKKIKNRPDEKWFSLMVRDFAMLKEYAEVPDLLNPKWFTKSPQTAVLKPKNRLPKTDFWPKDKVAFRICTLPEVAQYIDVPVTATSANISGKDPIFCMQNLLDFFGSEIQIYTQFENLPSKDPSQIWDFTQTPIKRIR